jgi:hypothetical protein
VRTVQDRLNAAFGTGFASFRTVAKSFSFEELIMAQQGSVGRFKQYRVSPLTPGTAAWRATAMLT